MGTSKLRVHSLVYESDDSHTRHPCDLHKPIATQGKCENVLPIVNECKGELTEVAGNLMVLFHSWCRKLTELGLRNTPNCTHVAVYLVSSLELTVNGEPGRLKYEINEETLLHFRALGYKWKDIAELLLVSCWTLWRWVGELGISEETGSTIIGNTDLDDSVQAFMNIQGGLVEYSMV